MVDENKNNQPKPPDVTQKITPVESFSANAKRYSASATAPKQKNHKGKQSTKEDGNLLPPENKLEKQQITDDSTAADLSGLDKSELISPTPIIPEETKSETNPPSNKDTHSLNNKTLHQLPYGIIVACICAAAAVCIICSIASAFSAAKYSETIQSINSQQETKAPAYYESSSSSSSNSTNAEVAETTTTPAHEHVWQEKYETVHHDPIYETVHHDATYKDVTTNHTVCNQCHEECDTEQEQLMHTAHTGHQHFTPNVPITKSVVDQAAYDEQVVVQAAYDEQVLTGYTCSCGEAKGLD